MGRARISDLLVACLFLRSWAAAAEPAPAPVDMFGADSAKIVTWTAFSEKLTNLKKTATVEREPGQWNEYEIAARGGVVTLKINGRVVNQTEGCDVVPGKICLTSEGSEIHFRNVQITVFDRAGSRLPGGRARPILDGR